MVQLKDAFRKLDEDESGTLTIHEMREASHHPEVNIRLKQIGFPVNDPESFFLLIDVDGSGDVSLEEFQEACVRLQGECRSRDMFEAEKLCEYLGVSLNRCEEALLQVMDKVRGVSQTH